MRILDEKTNNSISNLTILLEKDEAVQLIGYLEDLILEKTPNEHCHLNNADYSKEITIALYEKYNVEGFSDRYKSLIMNDK